MSDAIRELCRLLDEAGVTVTFDMLRDPKWQPSREDYAALRDKAREFIAAANARAEASESRSRVLAEALALVFRHGHCCQDCHYVAKAALASLPPTPEKES